MIKNLLLIFITGVVMACSPVKQTFVENKEETMSIKNTIDSPCPEEGNCKVQRIANVSLFVNEVEDGNKSEMYYELHPSKSSDVVIYSYNKVTDSTFQDGFYREEIIFEVPKEKQQLILENNDLQDIKMIFGRFCYCKGQTGYYKVKLGKGDIKYSKKQIKADLDIKVIEVPQLITKASFTVG